MDLYNEVNSSFSGQGLSTCKGSSKCFGLPCSNTLEQQTDGSND